LLREEREKRIWVDVSSEREVKVEGVLSKAEDEGRGKVWRPEVVLRKAVRMGCSWQGRRERSNRLAKKRWASDISLDASEPKYGVIKDAEQEGEQRLTRSVVGRVDHRIVSDQKRRSGDGEESDSGREEREERESEHGWQGKDEFVGSGWWEESESFKRDHAQGFVWFLPNLLTTARQDFARFRYIDIS
jgi:hypothetical protein